MINPSLTQNKPNKVAKLIQKMETENSTKTETATDAVLSSDSKKGGVKYNLTFWQKLELIELRLMWLAADKNKRKSWHEVKKGMEKHEHKFTKPFTYDGFEFLQCEHEGCRRCVPID